VPVTAASVVAIGWHHDGMVLAIWPSVMNPAVRLVLFGIGFTLAGVCVLVLKFKDRQIPRRRSVAYQTSMARISSALGWVAAPLFLVAGIASIALGTADLTR
jgi:hypothetical protein